MSTASLSALSEDGAEGDAGTRERTVASGERGCQGVLMGAAATRITPAREMLDHVLVVRRGSGCALER
jgi:hypothetical protein